MRAELTIRNAGPGDTSTLLNLIRGLAEYERLLDACVADEESLGRHLFGNHPKAYAAIAELDGEAIGFALWFYNFSTFLSQPGVHLEDLFVIPTMRGYGYGKALISHVAQFAVEHGCARFELSVLDWNEPAIGFYKSLGAEALDDWTNFRLVGDALGRLAQASAPLSS